MAWLVSNIIKNKYVEVPLHIFTDKYKAINYIVNYFYEHSTAEDRQTKVQIDEFDNYIEYSLYTSRYGNITLRLESVPFN